MVISEEIYSKNYKKHFANYRYTLKPVMIRNEPLEEGQEAKFTQQEFRRVNLATEFTQLYILYQKSEIRFVLRNATHVEAYQRTGKHLYSTRLPENSRFTIYHATQLFTNEN